MKIGIITFHRAHNYGAVLQCFALQKTLVNLGYEAEVIDYRQQYIERVYKPFRLDMVRRYIFHPTSLYHYFREEVPARKVRRQIFESFCSKYLTLSDPCTGIKMPNDYDAYIIGSDQLWGINCLGGTFDHIYFGQFPKTGRTIGYAISTNEKSIRSIEQDHLSSLLSNFDSLSLRERTMSTLISELTGIHTHVCLDPTLLLDKNAWNFPSTIDWKNKRYVLVYYVIRGFGAYAHNELLKKANAIAANIKAEVIDLSSMTYAVEDFVMSFKYAQCVVTSSFHASVFSVLFNTPLYSVKLHDGNDGRYVNLLKELEIEESIIEMDDSVEQIPQIDYDRVNNTLSCLRIPSIDFIRNSLR